MSTPLRFALHDDRTSLPSSAQMHPSGLNLMMVVQILRELYVPPILACTVVRIVSAFIHFNCHVVTVEVNESWVFSWKIHLLPFCHTLSPHWENFSLMHVAAAVSVVMQFCVVGSFGNKWIKQSKLHPLCLFDSLRHTEWSIAHKMRDHDIEGNHTHLFSWPHALEVLTRSLQKLVYEHACLVENISPS